MMPVNLAAGGMRVRWNVFGMAAMSYQNGSGDKHTDVRIVSYNPATSPGEHRWDVKL